MFWENGSIAKDSMEVKVMFNTHFEKNIYVYDSKDGMVVSRDSCYKTILHKVSYVDRGRLNRELHGEDL